MKKETPQSRYERERRGKTVMRVVLVPSDDTSEWTAIKEALQSHYGSCKEGIRQLVKENLPPWKDKSRDDS